MAETGEMTVGRALLGCLMLDFAAVAFGWGRVVLDLFTLPRPRHGATGGVEAAGGIGEPRANREPKSPSPTLPPRTMATDGQRRNLQHPNKRNWS